MSLKYCPSISWEGVRKIMTNELGVQTSDEYKARNVACSNLLFVNIAVHPPPPPPPIVKILAVHPLVFHLVFIPIEKI